MNAEISVLQANVAFTKNFYEIIARKKGNIFFSPISIHAMLSMLYQGAQGETAKILANALNNPEVKSTAEGYRAAIKRLNSYKHVTLLMANKIYGVEGATKFLKHFEKTIVECFHGETETLAVEDKIKAAGIVNKWVEEKTQNHIKNIVSENIFEKTLSLLLVNAIYFKGEWVAKFREESTKIGKFWTDSNNSVEVKMMHQKSSFWFKEDDDLEAQIIEMPYKGHDVKMMIILPTENNIENLEKKINQTDIKLLRKNMKLTEVHLYLPKFKMEETINLNDLLSEMGLKPIFDMNQANFAGILDTTVVKNNLFVSEIIQKSFIEVNEGGTVAAAATRAAIVLGCAPGAPKPTVFKVDHPALFLLLSDHGKEKELNILFYGRLFHPQF